MGLALVLAFELLELAFDLILTIWGHTDPGKRRKAQKKKYKRELDELSTP